MNAEKTLVADIGGTNCRFALAEAGHVLSGTEWQCNNADYPDLEAALAAYLGGNTPPKRAVIAAAGPVRGGAVRLTNGAWTITASALPFEHVTLLNDLQAMGYALALLPGPPGTRLVLNIGTGLNAASLLRVGNAWHAPAAELGYARLPMLDAASNATLRRCAEAFGAPVMEAVLSASSLPTLHRVLSGTSCTAEEITADWPADTLALYLEVLGAYLGDLALASLPTGGIWIAGSLGRAVFDELGHPAFRAAFTARGAYSELVSSFPISVLSDPYASLSGAAFYSAQGQAALS